MTAVGWTIFVVLICGSVCLAFVTTPKEKIKLGVIFDTGTDELQSALVAALQEQRQDPNLDFILDPAISVINTVNVYKISRLICDKVFSLGVHLLLGYVNPDAFDTLHSYANTFRMPFVAPWFPQKVRQLSSSMDFTLSMRPEYHQAVMSVAEFYHWTEIVYMYDSEDGLHRLQQILQSLTPGAQRLRVSHARRVFRTADALRFLRSLEEVDRWSSKRVVLDCDSSLSRSIIISHVRDVHLGRRNYHYILSGLVLDEEWSRQVEEFGAVNITGFRLVDRDSPRVKSIISRWKINTGQTPVITARTALMYDSVLVITEALRRMWPALLLEHGTLTPPLQLLTPPLFNCSQGFSADVAQYSSGMRIMRQFSQVQLQGLTGNISFSEHGKRSNYRMNVVEMSVDRLPTKIGEWSDKYGFLSAAQQQHSTTTTNNNNNDNDNINDNNKSNTIIITSIEEPPFLMRLSGSAAVNSSGNDLYVGYCKDLAELLSNQIGFQYELRTVSDGKYGSVNRSMPGGWDGIVGELITNDADLAVAPLTISLSREQVLAFTKPFMTLGISIMIKKPIKKNPGVFSFLNPLSREVWMCIVFAYLGVSIVLFLVSRFSPYEQRRQRLDPATTATAAAGSQGFGIGNSLWFAMSALMQQDTDLRPRSFSSRLVSACWWFFCLFFVASYTANLAAFLTVDRLATPINSVSDLATQDEVEYGTVADGSTVEFFQNSQIGLYQRMWEYMSNNPHTFVRSYKDGVRRVRNSKGRFALLVESSLNDYVNERMPCDTMKVGSHLNTKGYGLATPKNSPIKDSLNLAVLRLTENGELAKLQNKWWIANSECKESEESPASELLLSNLAGIFYVLIAGLVLSMFIALIEFCYKSKSEASSSKTSHITAMRARARMTLTGDGSDSSSEHKVQYYGGGVLESPTAPTLDRPSSRITGNNHHAHV